MNKRTRVTICATADPDLIRTEVLNDIEHLVVPIIMLVEGVHTPGNIGRGELALAEEFGKYDGLDWNGRPVVLGHPSINGVQVSANSPAIIEQEQFGTIFNSQIKDKKLLSEVWIDTKRIEELDREDINDRITSLQNGEIVEVSTGLYTFTEEISGRFNNEAFEGIWRDVSPDHLAILPKGQVGACSVSDGCGAPRINSKGKQCDCKGTCGTCSPVSLIEVKKDSKTPPYWRYNSSDIIMRDNESHADIREAIDGALQALNLLDEDGYPTYYYVVSIYDSAFVYASNGSLYQRTYRVSSNSTVTIGSDAIKVRPVTEYTPLNVKLNKRSTMNKTEKIEAVITNAQTQFTVEDKTFLEGLEEVQLDKLMPVEAKTTEVETKEVDPASPLVDPTKDEKAGPNEDPVVKSAETVTPVVETRTIEQYLSEAPPGIREVISQSLSAMETQRNLLVDSIKTNSRNSYSEKELKDKPLDELKKIASLASIPDYSGAVGIDPSITEMQTALNNHEPPKVFEQSTTKVI